MESLYDPYRINKKENIEHNICKLFPYHNSMIFHSDTEEAKIVPLTRYLGDLILNLIYINKNIYDNPIDFIANDFDIDICKQSFNGKRIKLHSINNLIHKKFEYNLNHILNNKFLCKNNCETKYICFRKRLEKYKANGFVCKDEKNIINTVKELFDI